MTRARCKVIIYTRMSTSKWCLEQNRDSFIMSNRVIIFNVPFYYRSFENNLKTYKLLAHRKPESDLPHVSHQIRFPALPGGQLTFGELK